MAKPASGTLEHTADLGLWVEADTPEELAASAATALAELMFAGSRAGELDWRPFVTQGEDRAALLVELLNEVVYLADGQGRLVAACEVAEFGPVRLQARLGVIPLDPSRHRPREPVKAVTYHQADCAPRGRGWRAQVYLDV